MQVPKDFRSGWLLLLMRDGSSYGYELRRELASRDIEIDRAVMYRGLREMESVGLIVSSWTESESGPRRRVYRITQRGRDELERIVAELRITRNAHEAFLRAYAEARGKRKARP